MWRRLQVEQQTIGRIQGAIAAAETDCDHSRQQRVILEQKLSEVQIEAAAETERLRAVTVSLVETFVKRDQRSEKSCRKRDDTPGELR